MHALAIAVVAAVAAQGGQVVGLAVQPPVGVTDEEVAPLKDKIADEFSALGMMLVHADPVDAACVPDPACVEQVRAALPEAPSALLVIELLRVGPVLQLTATAAAGEARATGSHGLDDAQMKKGPVLPPEVRAWATALAEQHSAAAATTETPSEAPTGTPNTGDDGGGFGITPMRGGALFALGVGVVAIAAGAIVAGTQDAVLGDPASTGDAKEGARTLGLVGLGVLAVGVVGVAGGAALFLLE